MSQITTEMIKELRARTGAGILDCRKALREAEGDMAKAIEYLKKKSLAVAQKKAGRVAAEGLVGVYQHHNGRIGVLVEVNCETDFVAKTEDFQEFVGNVAKQIAAYSPQYVSPEDIPEAALTKQRALFAEQAREEGKPDKIIDRIVEGRMKKWYGEVCLLHQSFLFDEEKTVGQILTELIGKLGENIKVRRFVRFEVGEGLEKKSDDFAAEVAAAAGV